MRKAYIYQITNLLNGKAYIGQHDGSKNHYYASGMALRRAVNKYGKENFKRERLVEGYFDQELLDLLETEAIEKYQTYAYQYPEKGYNLTLGGSGQRGYVHRKESITLIRNHSPRKPVYQFTTDGILIAHYPSVSECHRQTKYQISGIVRACADESIIAYGFCWSYKTKHTGIKKTEDTIAQYTLEGEFVASYPSMAAAGKAMSVVYTAISNAIRGSSKSCCGFKWTLCNTHHNAKSAREKNQKYRK